MSNIIKNGNQSQLQLLLERGIIEHMGRIVQGEVDSGIQEIVLKGIGDLLGLGLLSIPGGYSPEVCRLILEQNDVMKVIEGLKNGGNSQVAVLARKISNDDDFNNPNNNNENRE